MRTLLLASRHIPTDNPNEQTQSGPGHSSDQLTPEDPTGMRHLQEVYGGFRLRVPRWYPGQDAQKNRKEIYFYSEHYGGEERALAAAKAWRKRLFDDRGIPTALRGHTTNSRAASQIVGVRLMINLHPAHKPGTVGWVAAWMVDKKRKIARYSLAHHTFEEALVLAVSKREEMTGILVTAEQLVHAFPLKRVVDEYLKTGRRIQI